VDVNPVDPRPNASSVHEVLGWADAHADGCEIEILAVIGTRASHLVGPLDHSDAT
jgi:hypothetical protein